jgi:N-acetylglucosaminyldiphosphoundecaprenol N-acetyl-beta-D-mannosaminyltransferase
LKKKIIKKIILLNTRIDCFSMSQTIEKISNSINNNQQIHHVVVNAAKIVALQKDLKLRESVNCCDIINADGQAVVWASRFLKNPLPERVAGIDLMENLVVLAHKKEYKIFFLGAREEIVSNVVSIYSNKFSPNIIAGYRNGYFDKDQEKSIAKQVSDSGANILFVAISSPKKEIFLNENKSILKNVNFIMGVGGSFDVVSGLVKRAPQWMQKFGLEWLYRLIQEPKRMWRRYLVGNTKFIFLVLKAKYNQIFT